MNANGKNTSTIDKEADKLPNELDEFSDELVDFGRTIQVVTPRTSVLQEIITYEEEQKLSFLYLFFKRAMDILTSLIALILLLPLFLFIAVMIKLNSEGSVFFHHKRVGMHGKPLMLHKFRTMKQNSGDLFSEFTEKQRLEFEQEFKLDNDPRITTIGKLLRESSLDELPQLMNILQGSLSLVGPRPLIEAEVQRYGSYRTRLLSVKPGLTGHWQVNGRNEITYQERMQLEMYYVDNASLWLDIKILFMTVPAVLKKVGAK